jgi:ABC-type transport system involved in Fe-S cluster assembly fused permease/ATPase subunit
MADRGSSKDDSLQSWKFGWNFAAVTAVTMLAYAWFTIKTTAWR